MSRRSRLGSYIADVDVVAHGGGAPAGGSPGYADDSYTTAAWLRDLPLGAAFVVQDLTRVMSEVMTDDAASTRQLRTSTRPGPPPLSRSTRRTRREA